MRVMSVVAILLFCSLPLTKAHGQTAKYVSPCDAFELVGQGHYDELICAGIAAFERKNYSEAVALFERAMTIPIHEFPNFLLYPRLALAYSRNGERAKAMETLEKADLALRVMTRMVLCVELDDGDYKLVWSGIPQLEKVESPYYDEILGMCGAANQSAYYHNNLEGVSYEAEAVRRYLELRQMIQSDQRQ